MAKQVAAVRAALAAGSFDSVPVHPNLLFNDESFGLFSKPKELGGVRLLWAKKLLELIRASSQLTRPDIDTIAAHLSTALPTIRQR